MRTTLRNDTWVQHNEVKMKRNLFSSTRSSLHPIFLGLGRHGQLGLHLCDPGVDPAELLLLVAALPPLLLLRELRPQLALLLTGFLLLLVQQDLLLIQLKM